jgi:hypothetical protein
MVTAREKFRCVPQRLGAGLAIDRAWAYIPFVNNPYFKGRAVAGGPTAEAGPMRPRPVGRIGLPR